MIDERDINMLVLERMEHNVEDSTLHCVKQGISSGVGQKPDTDEENHRDTGQTIRLFPLFL